MEKAHSGCSSEDEDPQQPDVLHVWTQIRFSRTFIEIAQRHRKSGEVEAATEAERNAREAAWEARQVFTRLSSEARLQVAAELEALESILSVLPEPAGPDDSEVAS